MYQNINLEYGMKILFPCRHIMLIPLLGLAMTSSSDETEKIEMVVCKYWESDTDANKYKVRLEPFKEEDKIKFAVEKLYSSDLKSLIRSNVCSIIN